jgi:hypothetical protein
MTVSPVLDAAGRRRSPATSPPITRDVRRATRGCATPRTRRPWRNHRDHAPDRRRSPWLHAARADRRAVARRAAHSGSDCARRARPRPPASVAAGAQRGRSAPRDRHGHLGLGAAATVARRARRAADRPAVLRHRTGRPAGGRGRARTCASSSAARAQAGVRRRFAPHQLRHAHAVELAREGMAVNVIQRQLGTPASARPASTCMASIPKRSSPRYTPGARR